MIFEKTTSFSGATPLAKCSGCSNSGEQVFQTNLSGFLAHNAGRCTTKG